MTYLSDQKTRMLAGQSNVKGIYTDSTKRTISSSFFNSPSYYQVQVNTYSNPNVSSNLDSRIVDDSKTKELKQIQLIPDQVLNFGDIITWQGEHWITTSVDYQGGIYFRGSIQKCPSSIKWKDSKGAIREAWFALTTDIQRGLGLDLGKVLTMPNERRYIIIQKNAYTSEIAKLQRFIFDEGRCWKVTSINSLFTNLITLELEEMPIATELDNLTLRIANYSLHNYTIEIHNGTSVNMSIGKTLQLIVTTKDNGTMTDQIPITYTTTNNTIATVNSTGLIQCVANGNVTVKAALTNDPTVFSTMSVNVSNVVQSGWTLDIKGNDYCKVNQIQRFTGEVKNNGITDTSKLIRWKLYDDSGELPTELGTIISQSGSEIVIKASKQLGYIKIKGTCYAGSNFTVEDVAAFTVADLSSFTVDELSFVGMTTQTANQVSVQTVDQLFNLKLTVEQMATLTVNDLAIYTVGDLVNEAVLVSSVKRVQIKGLI